MSESLLLVRGDNFVRFGLTEHAQDKVDDEGRQKITPESMKDPAHVQHTSRAVTHSRFWFMMTTVTSAARRSLRGRDENGKPLGAPHVDAVRRPAWHNI